MARKNGSDGDTVSRHSVFPTNNPKKIKGREKCMKNLEDWRASGVVVEVGGHWKEGHRFWFAGHEGR